MKTPGLPIAIGILCILLLAGCSAAANNPDLAGKLSDIRKTAQEQDTSEKKDPDENAGIFSIYISPEQTGRIIQDL